MDPGPPAAAGSRMPSLQWRDVLGGQWEGEVKRRSVPDRALDPDLSPMHLHDLLNDREAQASPRYRLCGATAHAAEALEDVADLVRRDAHPGVGDADQRKAPFGAAGKGHRAAVRRVLDSVVHKVADDLDEPVAVADHDGQARIQVGLELDRWRGARPRDGIAQDLVDVHVGRADAHPPRLHPVEVKHVPDEAIDTIRV